ncbi:unnamed protein product [Dicrocoelium dendriticum]|nr:unnamed protein product [Dicrocoelium dendriticum]
MDRTTEICDLPVDKMVALNQWAKDILYPPTPLDHLHCGKRMSLYATASLTYTISNFEVIFGGTMYFLFAPQDSAANFAAGLLFLIVVPSGSKEETGLIEFHLSDNTPGNHTVGNILHDRTLDTSITRTILYPNTLFKLTIEGFLITRDKIDRDLLCGQCNCCDIDECRLRLEAYIFHSSATPTMLKIVLVIRDENDNSPTFPWSPDYSWELSIPESATAGSTFPLPVAVDRDSPKFGVHIYRIFSVPLEFDVAMTHPVFSLITSNRSANAPLLKLNTALDREARANYEYLLVAEDDGPFTSNATLRICVKLQDVNDNPPVFLNLSASAALEIREDEAVGSIIYHFIAKDEDEGINNEFTFAIDWTSTFPNLNQSTLQQLSAIYSIHPKTGELRIQQPLDYENDLERRVVLIVKATDQGIPKLTASCSLTLFLVDVNDNSPEIEVIDVDSNAAQASFDALVTVEENESTLRLLKMVSVSDADSVSRSKVTCKLTDHYAADFSLISYSHTMYGLYSARVYDFERDTSPTGLLSARLECYDAGEPPRMINHWIHITLGNKNDNVPQFTQVDYKFSVSEDIAVGANIGQVHAHDADSESLGTLFYEISADNPELLSYLHVDSQTGVVKILKKLDREWLSVMHYLVTASDEGEKQVVLKNDTNSSSTVRIASNIRSNTTNMTIVVLDVNDNPPIYTGQLQLTLTENMPTGTVILPRFEFSDADLGENGTIYLLIESVTAHFKLQIIDGGHLVGISNASRLVTLSEIDREMHPKIVVVLLAVDQGTPTQLSATVTLTILIADVNDNAPYLVHPVNMSLLPETSDPGLGFGSAYASISTDSLKDTLVAVIYGRDNDLNMNGVVKYKLVEESQDVNTESFSHESDAGIDSGGARKAFGPVLQGFHYFSLDSTNGRLTTKWGKAETTKNGKSLEEKEKEVSVIQKTPNPGIYFLLVELSDSGIPPLITRTLFYVNISKGQSSDLGAYSFLATKKTVDLIMCVVIVLCCVLLITGLTGTITWVRFRAEICRTSSKQNKGNLNYTDSAVVSVFFILHTVLDFTA